MERKVKGVRVWRNEADNRSHHSKNSSEPAELGFIPTLAKIERKLTLRLLLLKLCIIGNLNLQ